MKTLIFFIVFNLFQTKIIKKTNYFLFYLEKGREKLLSKVIENADKDYERMSKYLDIPLKFPVEVEIADSEEEFLRFQREEGAHVEWAVGIAFPRSLKIVLRIDKTYLFSFKETFLHEVCHILLLSGNKNSRYYPKWFIEGLAIFMSGEGVWKRVDTAIKAASVDSLIPIDELNFKFPYFGTRLYLAYSESSLFVRYLINRFGMEKLVKLIKAVNSNGKFFKNFSKIYGSDVDTVFNEWKVFFSKDKSILSFFSNDIVIWVIITLMFLLTYLKISFKKKKRLKEMEEEERLEEMFYQEELHSVYEEEDGSDYPDEEEKKTLN